jgi:hypothetical protein
VGPGARETLEFPPSTAARAVAGVPAEHFDAEWSERAGQRSASVTRHAVAPQMARSRLTQEAAAILRAEAAAVTQAAAELRARSAALRLRVQAAREREHAGRGAGSPPPTSNACDTAGAKQNGLDHGAGTGTLRTGSGAATEPSAGNG